MLWGIWKLPHTSHLLAQQSDVPSLQKAGSRGLVLLGFPENSLIMPHWDPGRRNNLPYVEYGSSYCGKVFLKPRHILS